MKILGFVPLRDVHTFGLPLGRKEHTINLQSYFMNDPHDFPKPNFRAKWTPNFYITRVPALMFEVSVSLYKNQCNLCGSTAFVCTAPVAFPMHGC